jgi:hypothetical protein
LASIGPLVVPGVDHFISITSLPGSPSGMSSVAQPLGQLSPFSPRMPVVVEVAPWGLLFPLAYVVNSIRFFDSTPLPCQRQRHARTPEKMTSPMGGLGLRREAEGGSCLTEATGLRLTRARIRGRGWNDIWGRYAFHVEERSTVSLGQRMRSCP